MALCINLPSSFSLLCRKLKLASLSQEGSTCYICVIKHILQLFSYQVCPNVTSLKE